MPIKRMLNPAEEVFYSGIDSTEEDGKRKSCIFWIKMREGTGWTRCDENENETLFQCLSSPDNTLLSTSLMIAMLKDEMGKRVPTKVMLGVPKDVDLFGKVQYSCGEEVWKEFSVQLSNVILFLAEKRVPSFTIHGTDGDIFVDMNLMIVKKFFGRREEKIRFARGKLSVYENNCYECDVDFFLPPSHVKTCDLTHLCCSISKRIPVVPVFASDGLLYDLIALKRRMLETNVWMTVVPAYQVHRFLMSVLPAVERQRKVGKKERV